ncbi:MAG: hypothetical protein KDB07_13420, partial [Planctomycetes bacterium]|nr:hypothetical protein [Planctomycetota bacterium]
EWDFHWLTVSLWAFKHDALIDRQGDEGSQRVFANKSQNFLAGLENVKSRGLLRPRLALCSSVADLR